METQEVMSDYERERGKPMPSRLHGLTQANLIMALAGYHHAQYTIYSELTLALNGQEVTPDISIYPQMAADYVHDDVRMTEPPLVAVEIMSPTQGVQDLIEKIQMMLEAGVQSCWLIQPTLQTVTVFSGAMQSNTFSEGVIKDPTTEIEVAVDDIFAKG